MADNKKYTTIHYHSYLQLDKILGAQKLRSAQTDNKGAHEETLFIIIHQVYELWFKQIRHELNSVMDAFDNDELKDGSVGKVVARLERVEEIFKLLIKQIDVLETMTPLDFLDFRAYLFPASGFQSFQFRLIENMLGLKEKQRVKYGNVHYKEVFPEEQQKELEDIRSNKTLFERMESWLERIPFLEFEGFDFIEQYKIAVQKMIDKETEAINKSDYLSDKNKEMRVKMLGDVNSHYRMIFDEAHYNEMKKEGNVKMSYKSLLAALLIKMYRDEPILTGPYNLLMNLGNIDSLLTTWRYRHAQMVLKMLGRKTGTGGSSGHKYLKDTAESHNIFTDLHSISTMLIPRSELPKLPEELKKKLGFSFS